MHVASRGEPAARPTFKDSEHVSETLPRVLRVGLDVSPLALTKAGTARYLTNLLDGLERDNSLEVRRYSFEGSGRMRRIVRDTVWYPVTVPRAAKRDGVDVLHCTSMRAPFRSRVPLVVSIHDVAVDMRPDSPSHLRSWSVELTEENGLALFIPDGCAHGFQTLADATEVHYQMSTPYVPGAGRGVRWDDPAFGIEWPDPPPGGRIGSERDATYPDFER